MKAIILAAGLGTRLRPMTENTPTALVKVNQKPLVEYQIEFLKERGIDDIIIVVGYLKEQFYSLEKEYEGLKVIENPYFDTCNNISSLYVAREHLNNTIILDGDQMIFNTDILKPEFERSGYNSVYVENGTDEWLQQVENGIVTSCSRTGGSKGWQLYSISRWNTEDGQQLKKDLEEEFDVKQNRQIYWDDVAMFCHPDHYQLGVMPMKASDVVEIDGLDELVQIDPSYSKYLKGVQNEK